MLGSLYYGLLLGVGFATLPRLPQPAGTIIWFGLLAAQLSWGASVVWRKTALPFATAAMLIGAATFWVVVAFALAGWPYPDLPVAGWIACPGRDGRSAVSFS